MEAAALGLLEPSTDVIAFTALGFAQPGGSKRAFRHNHTGRIIVADDNRKAKPWQAVVASAGHEAMAGRALLDGPLAVRIVFFQPRPKGHFGSGRNSAVLKPSAPPRPIVRPDVLKLSRTVEDALTGVCWRDDSLIVSEKLEKHYGEPARCVVEIAELGAFS